MMSEDGHSIVPFPDVGHEAAAGAVAVVKCLDGNVPPVALRLTNIWTARMKKAASTSPQASMTFAASRRPAQLQLELPR